ncbi:MAG: two-component regulator propeller domain-containing protein [Rikenellaceae bacterium]
MNKRLLYTIISLFIFNCFELKAEIIDTANGLSHNGVTSIVEDCRGYLWVGTYDGLNIYNGNNFSVIRNNADTTILNSNRVRSLHEVKDGKMWIGTDRGVVIYDFIHNKILDVKCGVGLFQNEDIIKRIIENRSGEIVALVENGGVAIFTPLGELKSYKRLAGGMFNDICEVATDQYMVTSTDGIYLFDGERQEYSRAIGGENDTYDRIAQISEMRYVITAAVGVAVIDVSLDDNRVQIAQQGKTRFNYYRFKAVHLDSFGNLWLGSNFNGVSVVENFEKENENYRGVYPMQNLRISFFCEGGNDRLWIGSYNRGIINHSLKQNMFRSVEFDGKEDIYRTGRLFSLDDEHIAIKTDNINYQRYNLFTGESSDLFAPKINLRGVSAAQSKSGYIWVVSGFAEDKSIIKVTDKRNYTTCQIDSRSDRMPHGVPRSMIEDTYGNLWVVYNKSIYRISNTKVQNRVLIERIDLSDTLLDRAFNSRSLYVDPKDNSLWVPTIAVGLYHIKNPEAQREELIIENYQSSQSDSQSLPSNLVTSVVRSNDGTLWVGMEQGGLCRLDEQNLSFEPLKPEIGEIANNNIKSILCDNANNRLWIATNVGISIYDISTKTVVNYGRHDGIPSDAMSFLAAKVTDDLFVFVGSDCSFMVDVTSEVSRTEIPQFHFGKLRLYSTVVDVGQEYDGAVLYDSRLESGDTIEFDYDQNAFSIEIDALHYDNHLNHNIRYRLLPINTEWITRSTAQGLIAFNGLPNGKYDLVVEVSSATGEWSESKTLHIVIHPPLWRTWWAYLIYLLIFVAGIWIMIKVFLKVEGYKHSMEVEAIERYNMAEKQRYFSNIAHEIKTPLALIMAPVDSLLETFAHDKEVRDRLQRINAQSRKMTHLIDVAQSIQLSDAGLLKLQCTTFDFGIFIENLLSDFKVLAKHDNKSVVVQAPASAVIVKADIAMVEKIANNLINNALKYTQGGDIITISWSSEGDNLLFMVADSGIGISEEDMPHIFERFYRGLNLSSQAPSGTGIGLSFSMRLARLHGGDITVNSELGDGSKFTVSLPVITADQPVELNYGETNSPESFIYDDAIEMEQLTPNLNGESLIYIVEDNVEMRVMLERIVGKFYNVQSFSSGNHALEAMEKRWPDLVVSDVMMPVMDGYELCEKIKGDIRTCHIPVILLTACASNEDKIKGKEIGADLYLIKPFYPKYLLTCIENTLQGRAKLRDRFKSGIPISFSDDRQTSQDNIFMEKFYTLITENIASEDLDLDKFARELGVNRTHFYQKIKNLTGQTPFDLIKEVRLVRSAELLVEGIMTIEDVCVSTGFKSRTHFSKLFKDKFGVSPGRYASSIKK